MDAERPGTAAQGTPENPLPLTDPKTMRALAHPMRIAIMAHLITEGPSTATECAAVAGLSPSASSYHLRTLARYGLVEEDPGSAANARERPWRAKALAFTVSDAADVPPAARAAASVLAASAIASAEEVRESYQARQPEYPLAWQHASGTTYDVLHVTPEELEELRERVREVCGEYRRLDQADRPDGARRVQVITDFTPWFEPEES